MDGKRKRQELPDGSGWGDHIQLLQIFESWDQSGYDPKWCSDHDLQVTEKNMFVIYLINKTYASVVSKVDAIIFDYSRQGTKDIT